VKLRILIIENDDLMGARWAYVTGIGASRAFGWQGRRLLERSSCSWTSTDPGPFEKRLFFGCEPPIRQLWSTPSCAGPAVVSSNLVQWRQHFLLDSSFRNGFAARIVSRWVSPSRPPARKP